MSGQIVCREFDTLSFGNAYLWCKLLILLSGELGMNIAVSLNEGVSRRGKIGDLLLGKTGQWTSKN
ncbi:hypothetical protein N182_34750 [Sinorhizobium sp. GL2]|nr:hypothetical protein N182_34750 [Sinorhizobium sp. GL2]